MKTFTLIIKLVRSIVLFDKFSEYARTGTLHEFAAKQQQKEHKVGVKHFP